MTPDEEQFQRDFQQLISAPPIKLEIERTFAWVIMSALQLACSHPGIDPTLREPIERFGRRLQAYLEVSPTLARIAEDGWNREKDVPTGTGRHHTRRTQA